MKGKNYLLRCFRFEEAEFDGGKLFKISGKCNITINDVDRAISNCIKQYKTGYFPYNIKMWRRYFFRSDKEEALISPTPYDFEGNSPEDLYFKNKTSLIIYGLNAINNFEDLKDLKKRYQTFLNFKKFLNKADIPSGECLKVILSKMDFELLNLDIETNLKIFSKEDINFFKTNLLKLAKKNDYDMLLNLAYQYYEGSLAFEQNIEKAEKLLLKLYPIKEDPFIANTLGYIYYYDRNNKGEKDKAFVYFSLGKNAGKIYESTYKLADCYIHGYGTQISKKAAFNLVNSIYQATYDELIRGHYNSKFADVSLRLGTYYKDGIGVRKDLNESHVNYLFAHAALIYRLENMNYIGDTGLASRLFYDLVEYYKPREIIDGQYYKLSKKIPQSLRLEAELDPDKDVFNVDENGFEIEYNLGYKDVICVPEINYSKVQKKVSFKVFTKNKLSPEEIKKIKEQNYYFYITNDSITTNFKTYKVDHILFKPDQMDADKIYKIVEVRLETTNQVFLYLYIGKDEKSTSVMVNTPHGLDVRPVVNVYKIYFDELPVPIKKLNLAYDFK